MRPPVAVLGATGQVGLFAVAALLQARREVLAVTRDPVATPHTAIDGLRRCGLAQLGPLLREPTAVGELALLSCGPIGLASDVLQSDPPGTRAVWERCVAIGTTSVEVKGTSRDASERREAGAIASAVAAIRERCESVAIPLTVLNPTLIYGCGMDQNLSRVWRWILRTGFAPLSARASGLRQPLHVADLAATIVSAIEGLPAPALETAVCGGEVLEYREMIGRLFDAAERKRRILPLPGICFGPLAGLSRLLPGFGAVSSESFRRQSRDQVFDDGLARKLLGHRPRGFHPHSGDFELPPLVKRVQRAVEE